MGRIFRENGLSIVLGVLFLIVIVGQSITGYMEYNQNQESHNSPTVGYMEYLTTGHFIEATFENWESEFLQMGLFVLLTVFLKQKGSPESKKLEGEEPVDADPREEAQKMDEKDKKKLPWPVRQGGLALKLYENSLTIVLFLLFFASFALHAIGGAQEYTNEQMQHGEQGAGALEYIFTSRFWFESLQNWQSEFLSVWALIVFSIFLRQRGSPESKPVAHPNLETGN